MSRPKVYLAGPMTGLTLLDSEAWREHAARVLAERFEVYSPLRGKEFLRGRGAMLPDGPSEVYGDQGIYRRDGWDVRRADIVLANFLGARQVSIGTCFELAWAHHLGKYVVVVMDEDNPHFHAFVRQAASVVFGGLDTALNYINETLVRTGGGA